MWLCPVVAALLEEKQVRKKFTEKRGNNDTNGCEGVLRFH